MLLLLVLLIALAGGGFAWHVLWLVMVSVVVVWLVMFLLNGFTRTGWRWPR